MTLEKSKKGQIVKILSIPDTHVRTQAIRFGLTEGSVVEVVEIVPFGPIVLSKNKQEIALGRKLAKGIAIEIVSKDIKIDPVVKSNINL